MIRRLAHLCFFTDDAPALRAFYGETLGFPEKFAMKHDDGTAFGWYYAAGETTFVEIFDQSGAVRQWGGEVVALKTAGQGTHYRHFCFEVEGIEVERERLVGKGLAVTPVKRGMDGSLQCWIKDPLGNDIELMEYTADSLQLK